MNFFISQTPIKNIIGGVASCGFTIAKLKQLVSCRKRFSKTTQVDLVRFKSKLARVLPNNTAFGLPYEKGNSCLF